MLIDISINKISIQGDKSALSPGGIRLGSSSLTSRGFKEDDFKSVVGLLHNVIELDLKIQNKSEKKSLILKNVVKMMYFLKKFLN